MTDITTKKLVEELYLCAAQCEACHMACNEEANKSALQRCMMLDNECMLICRLTGSLLDEDSENSDKFLHLCVEICKLCADECRKHPHEHCQQCAEQCYRCAEMCTEFLHHSEV